MQIILLFFALLLPLMSVPVDKALFEGENVLHYYRQIEKEINSTVIQKLKPAEIITLEHATLDKLRKLYLQKTEIAPVKTPVLPAGKIQQHEYLSALYTLAAFSQRISQLHKKEEHYQQKLFTLKNKIEQQTPKHSQNRLLIDQMQYAFYKISKDKIAKTLTLYTELYQKEQKRLYRALSRVHFIHTGHAQKIIQKTGQRIDNLRQKDLLLTIDKESQIPRTRQEKKKIIQDEKKLKSATDATLIKRLETQTLLALYAIREKKQDIFLQNMHAIDEDIMQLSPKKRQTFTAVSRLLSDFANQTFDTTSVALASTQLGWQNIRKSLLEFIDKTRFVYEEKAFSIRTVLIFLTILFIGSFIAKIYKNFVDNFRRTNRIKSLSTARMIANSGYYLIILATFFIALKMIGMDMHTIFLIIGAMLLWLAFGLQSFISNYAIGMLLKIDRSIRIGDHIELDPVTAGDVDDMDFRSVTIRSSDGVRTTIPNSRFIAGTFINHSREGECRRLQIAFSANRHIPHTTIEDIILKALAKSHLPYFHDTSRTPRVVITDINRQIVRYALLVWVRKEMTYDLTLARSAFLKIIHAALLPHDKTT